MLRFCAIVIPANVNHSFIWVGKPLQKMLSESPSENRTPKRFSLSPAQRINLVPSLVDDDDHPTETISLKTTPILVAKKMPKTPTMTTKSTEFKVPLNRPEWDSRPCPKTEKTRTNLTPRPVKADLLVNPLRGMSLNNNDSETIEIQGKRIKKLEKMVADLKDELKSLKLKFSQ